MTAEMSSSSDGSAERPRLSTRSRVHSSKKLATISKPRQSSSDDSPLQRNGGLPEMQAELETSSHRESEESARKRHKSSKANGFLLDESSRRHSPRQSDFKSTSSTRHNTTPSSSKGKAKALGRSPLGVGVMSNRDGEPTDAISSRDENAFTNNDIEETKRNSRNADTNQAQIVNLALNLSESRRRHFSSNRISSLDTANFRVPSRALLSSSPATPYSVTSRQFSSPRAPYSLDSAGSQSPQSSQSPRDSSFDVDSPLRAFGLATVEVEDFYPSEATLIRVQKAKEALELTYQHRRLLQYLPQLPAANQSNRPQSNRKTSRAEPSLVPMGRTYNPLQYIRNRKIRRRENKPLNAEGQGWKQVGAVQQWIDVVCEENDIQALAADPFPLPPFPLTTKEIDLQSPDSVVSSPVTSTPPSKEGRPRVEWMVDPWNLLADAYWLEQDNHKLLIEDSKSQKIFPAPLSAPIDLRKDAIRASARRSMSNSRSIENRSSSIISEAEGRSSVTLERGRNMHIRQHSTGDNRDCSGSRDRKGGWRRFIGSQSNSGAEEDSPSGRILMDTHKRSQMTAKERQESAILEKQIMYLMAREPTQMEHTNSTMNGHSDDQQFPGLSSRPSSPETGGHSRPVSLRNGRDLAFQQGLVDRTREMQPRRFSTTLTTETEPDFSQTRPIIAINVSPPRSRSRSTRALRDTSTQKALSDGEESSKLSPKSAHRSRRSFDSTREIKAQSSKVFESRLRGLLKGTKITGDVSNPAMRVGDLIWERDHGSEATDSLHNSNHYPPDEYSVSGKDVKETDDYSIRSNGHYQPANLPVFTSPFRGRQRGRSYENNNSHITVAALDNGGSDDPRGTSSAPKLRLRSTDPSPAPSASQSPEGGQPQTSSVKNNRTDGFTSTQRRDAVTVMGERMESAHPGNDQNHNLWPEKDSLQYLNITQRLLAPLHRTILHRDVSTLRAMTQCILVSSSSILRQRQETQNAASNSRTARSIHASMQRQLRASQRLLDNVTSQNTTIKATLNTLSATTFPSIHSSLLEIETYISNKLTPTVRTAGDDADKLSVELATTRTLDVKKLNDELDLIFRRRRRRLRWLRRGLYWGLEWTLLGLMWWAWLVVVCLRLVRGTVRAVVVTVKWLLGL